MKQHILFDLDDTLIHCNRFFNEARSEFMAAMQSFFTEYPIEAKLIDDTQQHIDLSGIEQHGLGKHRFPESLVATYRLMCDKYGKTPLQAEEQELEAIGYGVYTKPVELYPHAHETLEVLSKEGHELYLYTGGDLEIQTSKVLRAGLDQIFPEQRRFVSEHKNRSVLARIMQERNLQHEHTWMIGNSARNDIRPALEEGIHAIHLPDKGGWSFDHADLNVPVIRRFITLDTIQSVPEIIRKHVADVTE
ncbi:HAD family hydrolase [Tumebacillus permanentifrigoris]|uniref:Putative hydrolase of the HAD superfamily n=1 Tax=Tumebacillus permanentifrigoris TaxID=378543 RepID=A0A316D8U0_9BACL|nr:HAD family hydrolase [Tumebacillus permanentifrigoris]PWK11485.1 putative hydrolase of the HAD superfamily [Tumebacillus permanentifrigoris]